MTIDPFVFLAPILLLAVIALLRFVGCDILFRIDTVPTDTPMISGFDPADATVGDLDFELTVSGSNFAQGATVKFGSTDLTPGSVVSSDNTQIKVTVPANAPELHSVGSVTVTVTNPDHTQGSKDFSVLDLVTVSFPGPGPNDHASTPPGSTLNSDASQGWAWELVGSDDPIPHIFFAGGAQSGTFTFPGPGRLLKSMAVSSNSLAGTLTVTDNNSININQKQILNIPAGSQGQSLTLTINWPITWKLKSTTVTVAFTNPNSLSIHEIKYQGPV